MSDLQKRMDTFYFEHGPCCAGCDWWRYLNSQAGECLNSKIVGGHERAAMLGIQSASLNPGAGHAFTKREHHCGNFKDTFDWSTLTPRYLREVGAPAHTTEKGNG